MLGLKPREFGVGSNSMHGPHEQPRRVDVLQTDIAIAIFDCASVKRQYPHGAQFQEKARANMRIGRSTAVGDNAIFRFRAQNGHPSR
jgi:hypothetical protein